MATGILRQVELDAIRIQSKRFRDDEEERQYKQSQNEAEVEVVEEPTVPKVVADKKGK